MWAAIKKTINSTLGTANFAPLDNLLIDKISGDTELLDLAINDAVSSLKKDTEIALYDNYYESFSTYVDVWGDNDGKILVVPKHAQIINEEGFRASQARRIILPRGLIHIGIAGFYDCANLTEIVLPDGCEYIGMIAFAECSALRIVTIPESIKEIAPSAFRNTDLKDVYYKGTQAQWEDIIFGDDNDELLNATIHYNS